MGEGLYFFCVVSGIELEPVGGNYRDRFVLTLRELCKGAVRMEWAVLEQSSMS